MSVSLSNVMINWQIVGVELARLFLMVLTCALLFRQFVAPGITETFEEIQRLSTASTNLAKLAGVKSNEYTAGKNIEKSVARDIINEKIPELEALKVFLSSATWDEIQETIDNNPEAILQLWDKYGHLIGGLKGKQKSVLDF